VSRPACPQKDWDFCAIALRQASLLYKPAMRPRNFGKNRGPDPGKNRGKPEKRPVPTQADVPEGVASGAHWLYGLHTVQAALANPRRKLGRAVLTPRAAETLGPGLLSRVRIEIQGPGSIDRLLPPGAVHQGAALQAFPLKSRSLDEILGEPHPPGRRVVLVLDQLCDPHNVGAILRTALAFGAAAVIVQDRHAPPQSGALAKAASGALDLVPYVEVVNIARTLDELAQHGFWRIALEGDGTETLAEAVPAGDVALVLGSEGSGIRRLVREHCEASAFIPISRQIESLNVSNAAAIALYELSRRQP
jgi:23S rRNA (guanosine2251-2'-O)-methyltransferase